MKIHALHDWDVSHGEAKALQVSLAKKVVTEDEGINPHLIAGVDISSPDSRGIGRGAVVVLNYPELNLVEVKTVEREVAFPYIPGLLSFREAPLIVAACEELSSVPDLVLVDGQGIAHPRRFGLASHLGLFFDVPTIGCAKSILCGAHKPVGEKVGSYAELVDNDQVIGSALRTRIGVKPIYVSIGHKISLSSAIKWVLNCCRGYRLCEPTRLAHLAAGGNLRIESGEQGKLFD
ncbi:Endonuclease V [subsurface metagenome]